MTRYSDEVDALVQRGDLLQKLCPAEPADTQALLSLRGLEDGVLTGGRAVSDAAMLPLIRGGLLYLLDAIHESHVIAQNVPSDTGSYWHGMIHRREGDFENARYWFRRAGTLPAFDQLHSAASQISPLMARQTSWDPYLFTGQCEQQKFGATELTDELIKLQRLEFDVLFDYVWRITLAPGKEAAA